MSLLKQVSNQEYDLAKVKKNIVFSRNGVLERFPPRAEVWGAIPMCPSAQ
jgi:hypothetical protein